MDVSILTYASQRVWVTGATARPAVVPLTVVPLTLHDAVSNAGFNPVAIASRNPETAKAVAELHQVPRVHPTIDALLADPDIEILDVAVPPDAEPDMIRKAVSVGKGRLKGILAQKPLALSVKDAKDLVQRCADVGIVLAVGDVHHAAGVAEQERCLLALCRCRVDLRAALTIEEKHEQANARGQRRLAVFPGNEDERLPIAPHVAAECVPGPPTE